MIIREQRFDKKEETIRNSDISDRAKSFILIVSWKEQKVKKDEKFLFCYRFYIKSSIIERIKYRYLNLRYDLHSFSFRYSSFLDYRFLKVRFELETSKVQVLLFCGVCQCVCVCYGVVRLRSESSSI